MAGLDLCYDDVLSHARPNAFERRLPIPEGRCAPLHHQLYAGAREAAPIRIAGTSARTSLSLQTYTGWFREASPRWRSRVRRLDPSPVDLPSIPPISPDELRSLCLTPRPRMEATTDRRLCVPPPRRRAFTERLIGAWRSTLQASLASVPSPGTPAFEIARHLALRELLEVRRRLRAGDAEGARRAWEHAVAGSDAFLATLAGLARGTPDA